MNHMANKFKSQMLVEAIRLARAGYYVFPVNKDKTPIITDWPNQASIDEMQIRQWYDKPNPPNLAVITGHKSGCFCLDVDGDIGKQSLTELEEKYGQRLDIEHICSTPSNGQHYFFQMPSDTDIRNSAGKIGKNLDIRASGGYVLVWPSVAINRFDGKTGCYRWIISALGEKGLSAAPQWLLDLITEKRIPEIPFIGNTGKATGSSSAYGFKALEEECAQIRQAAKGSRNDTLNRSAFAVFQLVAGGELSYHQAQSTLHNAALACGLGNREIQATLQSAQKRAFENPRNAQPASYSKAEQRISSKRQLLSVLAKPPLEVFPAKVRKLLIEAAVAFKRLPVEVPMVALLALLSGCVGRTRSVVVKDGWEEYANLFMVMVANSGLGKSPCFKEFFKPIWEQEVRKKDEWDIAIARYNAEMEERRQAKDRTVLGLPPVKPVREQYIVEDITLEALGGILAENPHGLLWCCDELSSIILNFDRYSNSKGGTKARLLSIYDGSPWKTSRRDQEKDKVIESAVLSLVGTVQPKILSQLFSQSDALSGLLPRIIFIQAKRMHPALLENEIFTGQETLQKIVANILQWRSHGEVTGQTRLSAEAYATYEIWHNRVATQAFYRTEIDKIIMPKLVTQAIRIALLLHCLKAALADEDGLQPVSVETVKEACILGDWILEQQKLVWQYLNIEDDSKNPIEQAIIMTALELEPQLASNNWKVSNESFNQLVQAKCNEPVEASQIGKIAASLGINSSKINGSRCKQIPLRLISSFKESFFI